ncbi:MAG: hypothetical protein ABIF88_02295 [archaeon]
MDYKKSVIKSQKDLKIIEETSKYLIVKAKFGPSKPTKIPLEINNLLSFFSAAIIADGHLKKSKKQINIELSNIHLLKYLQLICKKVFNRDFNIHPIKPRKNRKQTWHMPIDSKAIYNLLNQVFEIPIGKKSDIVKVPEVIKNSNLEIQKTFLQGIMFTDGGKRRRGYGISTASKTFQEDLEKLFEKQKIPVKKDKWVYQKYKKEFYGLFFKKDYYSILMRRCRSGQTGCV